MWQAIPRGSGRGLFCVGLVMAALLVSSTHASADDGPECTVGQERKILRACAVPQCRSTSPRRIPAWWAWGATW